MSAFHHGRCRPLVAAALLAALACAAVAAEHPSDAPSWRTAALSVSGDHVPPQADPFTSAGFRVPDDKLRGKWNDVERQMRLDAESVVRCRASSHDCTPQTRRFNDIVDGARTREGRARIGEINRAINLAIRPVSDMRRHGVGRCLVLAARNVCRRAGRLRGLCDPEICGRCATPASPRRLAAADRARCTPRTSIMRWSRRGFEDRWLVLDNRRLHADRLAA